MDPLTLALAGAQLGTQLFGLVQTAKGGALQKSAALFKGGAALQQSQLAAQSAMLQADTAGFNAELLGKQADLAALGEDFATAKGLFEENRLRAGLARTGATQAAGFGANHLDPNYGSPLLLMAESAAQGEVDARLIRAGAQVSAADAQSRAASIEGQAAGATWQRIAALMKANEALQAGGLAAQAGILGYDASAIGTGTSLLTQGASAFSPLRTVATGISDWWNPVDVGSAIKVTG